ncbi:MAG: sigma 54-interacting transcriptional regulator [Myxococcota bacterium]
MSETEKLVTLPPEEGQPLALRVLVGTQEGLEFSLSGEEPITLGGADDNRVVLPDGSVSRYHAQILRDGDLWTVRDLGSTNGTFVDRVKVESAELAVGRVVTLGRTALQVVVHSDEESTAGSGQPKARSGFGALVGSSRVMQRVYRQLKTAAKTDATVLLTGESGVGKELAAKALHASSRRSAGPWVVFDAASVPPELIESELFGHEAGAFTGAGDGRAGLFRSAHEGTLFVDEIGELPLALQPRLLRFLETRTVRKVGADEPVAVNTRIVAATHRDLREEVRRERFRLDLFWRLAVLPIQIPPLRDRLEDLGHIANAHLRRRGEPGLDDACVSVLLTHTWPGNVRELVNVLERAIVGAEGRAITPAMIRTSIDQT